jgi:eukaryotic-like serine/threonine-protein kinase
MATQPQRPSMQAPTETGSFSSDRDETAAVAPDIAAAPAFGPPAEPVEVGSLGPYRIVKELGRGGMGAVYAALDTRLERRLALKVMLPRFAADSAAKARFLREARSVARVKNDNVVTVYEADERDGVPYIAMEFLEGYPLDVYLRKKGRLTLSQAIRICAEAAAGLAASHALGLVHRDIKPGNLWLEAPNGRVKLLDFGLARPLDAEVELTRSGAVLGTPAYMSPEQARGERVDPRTDLFSLGVMLYLLCTGKLPFEGPTIMAVLTALGTREPEPVRELNPSIPESLAALIHQLLAKKPDDRPETADDVMRRLRATAQELAGSRARPAEPLLARAPAVRAPVGSAPIHVMAAASGANPFAGIGPGAAAKAPASALKPARTKPGGKKLWMTVGIAAVAMAVVGVIFVFKNKDGSQNKIEVTDGTTLTVKKKNDKKPAQVGPEIKSPGPEIKAPPAESDPDRQAADFVFSLGGILRVYGHDIDLRAAAELPRGRLTLDRISLPNSAVTDAGLANFKDCHGLRFIHLGNTAVTDAGLVNFKDRKDLWFLDLASTNVTGAGLIHFKDCKGLGHLNLFQTKVRDTELANFEDCKNIGYLNLGSTAVTDVGLAHFKDCKNLGTLILQDTAVTSAGLASFQGCTALTQLILKGTKVSDAGLVSFKDCKNLGILDLGSTNVTGAGLVNFKDCKDLWLINLPATGTTDADVAHFKDCKALGHLNLHGTKVTDAGVAHFKGNKSLGYLGLFGTGVTDNGLLSLNECSSLAYLGLCGTKVTEKGLAAFHAAVPRCKIEHDKGTIEPAK